MSEAYDSDADPEWGSTSNREWSSTSKSGPKILATTRKTASEQNSQISEVKSKSVQRKALSKNTQKPKGNSTRSNVSVGPKPNKVCSKKKRIAVASTSVGPNPMNVCSQEKNLPVASESDSSDFSDNDNEADFFHHMEMNELVEEAESCDEESDDGEELKDFLRDLEMEEVRMDELFGLQNDDLESAAPEIWTEYTGRQQSFEFTGSSGLQIDIPDSDTPLQVFDRIVDIEILEFITFETNRYAQTQLVEKLDTKYARVHR